MGVQMAFPSQRLENSWFPSAALCSAGIAAAWPYLPVLFRGLCQVNLIPGQQLPNELPAVPRWWSSSQTWGTTYRIRGSLSPGLFSRALCRSPQHGGRLWHRGAPAQGRWSSISSFTGLALGVPTQRERESERERPLPRLLSHLQPGSILGASTCVSSRQLAAAGREDPGMRSAIPPAVPPLSRPAEVGFGPPLCGIRPLLFALKSRPEQVTRWQQQTQEGPQMGFFAAGCTAGWFSWLLQKLSLLAVRKFPAPPTPSLKLITGGSRKRCVWSTERGLYLHHVLPIFFLGLSPGCVTELCVMAGNCLILSCFRLSTTSLAHWWMVLC